jgi:hypothetical protein
VEFDFEEDNLEEDKEHEENMLLEEDIALVEDMKFEEDNLEENNLEEGIVLVEGIDFAEDNLVEDMEVVMGMALEEDIVLEVDFAVFVISLQDYSLFLDNVYNLLGYHLYLQKAKFFPRNYNMYKVLL